MGYITWLRRQVEKIKRSVGTVRRLGERIALLRFETDFRVFSLIGQPIRMMKDKRTKWIFV
jgi:hypothetical protein